MEKQQFNLNPKNKLNNIIGHNFRLGEIECAIGIEQIKKLNKIIKKRRQEIAKKLLRFVWFRWDYFATNKKN